MNGWVHSLEIGIINDLQVTAAANDLMSPV